MPAISTTRRSCISPQRPRTVGVRKRPHQVGGLGAQLGLAAADRLEQRRDLGAGLDAVLLDLAQLLIDLLQHVADRRDQLVERLVLAGDLEGGVLLQPRQPLVGQLEELLVARLQRRAGHRLEALAQLGLGLLEDGHLLRDDLALVLQLGGGASQILAKRHRPRRGRGRGPRASASARPAPRQGAGWSGGRAPGRR